MQPQTPPPAPPPVSPSPQGQQNPYAFLYEDKKKKKKTILPRTDSTKQRIIFVGLGVVVLFIIVSVVVSLLNSASNQNVVDLQSVAKQQTEIIRVANIGASKAKDSKTSNFALTTSLSLASSQTNTLEALKKAGRKMSPKDLNAGKNTDTDSLLTKAEQANSFDETFIEEITKELRTYQTTVKKALASSSSENTEQNLQKAYAQVDSLLGTAE